MVRCVVLTNTTDLNVRCIGKLYRLHLTFLINVYEIYKILSELLWIKIMKLGLGLFVTKLKTCVTSM